MLAVALAACLLVASAEEGPKELSAAAHLSLALSADSHEVDQLGEASKRLHRPSQSEPC